MESFRLLLDKGTFIKSYICMKKVKDVYICLYDLWWRLFSWMSVQWGIRTLTRIHWFHNCPYFPRSSSWSQENWSVFLGYIHGHASNRCWCVYLQGVDTFTSTWHFRYILPNLFNLAFALLSFYFFLSSSYRLEYYNIKLDVQISNHWWSGFTKSTKKKKKIEKK